MSFWQDVMDFLSHLWSDIEADVAALAAAEVAYAKANITPDLVIAAREGYNAAETSDAKGIGKLDIASQTAIAYLGARAADYAFGAIVTAIQAVWKQQQINDAVTEPLSVPPVESE